MKMSSSRSSYGVAGRSPRAMMHGWRGWWLRSGWRSRLAVLSTVAMAGAVAGVVAGVSPLVAIAGSVGVVAVIAVGLAAPDALLVTAVSLVFLVVMGPLAVTYESGFFSVTADTQSAILGMFFSYLIALTVGVRWSRGQRWVTAALTAGSTIVPGLPLLIAVPGLGLNAARISMALVLVLRCGGWAWLSGTVGLLVDAIKNRGHEDEGVERAATPADSRRMAAWAHRADAEQRTAQLLASLDAEYKSFHDVEIPGSAGAVSHIVIGPGGGFVMASVNAEETPQASTAVPDGVLQETAAALLAHQGPAARTMKIAAADLQLVVVVHGGETQRKAFALYREGSQTPDAQVLVVSADNLLAEVAPGYVVWGSVKVSRLTRLLRMRARVAAAAQPARQDDVPYLSPVDQDGNTEPPTREGHQPAPQVNTDWMHRGMHCRVVTTLGVLTELRIVRGPYVSPAGGVVVDVCRDDEWLAAEKYHTEPDAYPYPVDSVVQQISHRA